MGFLVGFGWSFLLCPRRPETASSELDGSLRPLGGPPYVSTASIPAGKFSRMEGIDGSPISFFFSCAVSVTVVEI